MLTRFLPGGGCALSRVAVAALCLFVATACDKVPLLAPSGSVITLFPAASTVPVNGEVDIVATVIENGVATPPTTGGGTGTGNGTGNGTGSGTPATTTTSTTAGAGTPVQNGTVVSFTTTIGRIEPSEARTTNGQVHVRFIAGGQSGTATITAYSGGASGKIENLLVGTAAAERVLLTATPQTLGPSGGSTQISARVENASGLGVTGIPVTFTADAGTLSASSSITDSDGVARVTLSTTRQAQVTANVAGKTATVTVGLNPRTGISITPPANTVAAGQPATFTVAVGSTANITDVTINWGDGAVQSLGALSASTTVSHVYEEGGTYTVRATATDSSGFSEPVSTSITVLPAQPPSITVTASNTNPSVGETVILTATVSGNTSTITRYEWNFGTCGVPPAIDNTSNRATASWTCTGTKIVTVRAIQGTGPAGEGFGAVVVKP